MITFLKVASLVALSLVILAIGFLYVSHDQAGAFLVGASLSFLLGLAVGYGRGHYKKVVEQSRHKQDTPLMAVIRKRYQNNS